MPIADRSEAAVLEGGRQTSGEEHLRGSRVGKPGVERVLETSCGVVADLASGSCRESSGLLDKGGHELTLLSGEVAQLVSGERTFRVPKTRAELQQRAQLIHVPTRELVREPGDLVGLGQPMDLRGQLQNEDRAAPQGEPRSGTYRLTPNVPTWMRRAMSTP